MRSSIRSARPLPALAAMSLAMIVFGCEPSAEVTTGNPDVGGSETATATDPWGPMPTTVNPFYFTDFEEWVGKPIASQELARLIDRPIPGELDEGPAFLMFYRTDCEHCHHMLENWFTASVPAPTIAVEVPDTDPADAMPFPSTLVKRHVLAKGPDYVISTPALFAIKDGIVTGFANDPDDVESVETCISSNTG